MLFRSHMYLTLSPSQSRHQLHPRPTHTIYFYLARALKLLRPPGVAARRSAYDRSALRTHLLLAAEFTMWCRMVVVSKQLVRGKLSLSRRQNNLHHQLSSAKP